MHENDWQDMLPHYVNNTLSDEDRLALERHLAQCADCRSALEEWRALSRVAAAEIDALRDRLPPLALPGNSRRVSRGSNASQTPLSGSKEDWKMFLSDVLRLPLQPRRWSIPLTLVATVALTLLVGGIAFFVTTQSTQPIGLLIPQQQLTPADVFERYIDIVWNQGNLDALSERYIQV